MQETDSSGGTRAGENGPAAPPSEPPPSSKKDFIGTNADTAQAYVPPMVVPETPEAPETKVPETKVALAEEVDPRKARTNPALAKAARALLASELGFDKVPPQVVEAPPDSQSSGIRRGSGYAPKGNKIPPPVASSPRMEALGKTGSREARSGLSRTPPKPLSTRDVLPARARAGEGAETPAQRRAAMVLVLLFAGLLAVAVYFLLTRSQPAGGGSGSAPAPGVVSGAGR